MNWCTAMKLSEELRQDNDCGDFDEAQQGYAERAEEIEKLLMMCINDLYSSSGKFKKKTALALVRYTHANNIDVNP